MFNPAANEVSSASRRSAPPRTRLGNNLLPIKKRILFVDDDPRLVHAYALALQNQSDRWEVRSATSAIQALELSDRAAFDIVVADMRMPGMTGVDLISEIRKRHPQTSRVILSGVRDQEEIARCLGATHQFIPKPVDLETLRETVTRICSLDAFLMDDNLRALVGQFEALPSFPALYVEVVNELAAAEPSIERIAEIVAQDPGMTAKMLQLVNSAMFGLARRISDPAEIVQFLGTGTVRSLVLSVHVFSCFDHAAKGFSIEEFWRHSLRSAALARMICQQVGVESAVAEDAYLAGMLHDVGALMLASRRPEPYEQAAHLAAQRKAPLHEVETEIFGATHAGVGAYLLGLWGLPAPIVEAVAFHHTPNRSEPRLFGPLAAVHAADVLENELALDGPSETHLGLDESYLAEIGLLGEVEGWRARAGRRFQSPA